MTTNTGAGETGLWHQLWLSTGKGRGGWEQPGHRDYLWRFRGCFQGMRMLFFLTPMLLMGSFIGYFPEEVNLLPHSSPFTKEKARIWLSLGQESSVCDTWLRKLCLWQNYTQYRVVREFLSLVQKKRFAERLQRKEKDSGKSISLIPHLRRTKQ